MDAERKPCPICGHKHIKRMYGNTVNLECAACGTRGPECATEDEALVRWNTRPLEDALRTEVARLTAAQLTGGIAPARRMS